MRTAHVVGAAAGYRRRHRHLGGLPGTIAPPHRSARRVTGFVITVIPDPQALD